MANSADQKELTRKLSKEWNQPKSINKRELSKKQSWLKKKKRKNWLEKSKSFDKKELLASRANQKKLSINQNWLEKGRKKAIQRAELTKKPI